MVNPSDSRTRDRIPASHHQDDYGERGGEGTEGDPPTRMTTTSSSSPSRHHSHSRPHHHHHHAHHAVYPVTPVSFPSGLGMEESASPLMAHHPSMSNEEMEAVMEEFAKLDEPSRKTYSRTLVEKYLSKYKWYNPQRDDPAAPKLSLGWAYFEHVTLARHFTTTQTEDHRMERAEPGETNGDTELYNPCSTPESYLVQWGIGFGLYFATVRVMGFIFLLCGLINVFNIYYFHSTLEQEGSIAWLHGSAICTDWEWVPCVNCTASQWRFDRAKFASPAAAAAATATTDSTPTNATVSFVARNACDRPGLAPGMVNWGTLMICILSMVLLGWYQRSKERVLDEDKITAKDYTVLVKNPPPDATDPEAWRDFFSQFAEKQVTLCTIVLDNRILIKSLVKRRVLRRKLAGLLPDGVDLDDADAVQRAMDSNMSARANEKHGCLGRIVKCITRVFCKPFNVGLDEAELHRRIHDLEGTIKELQQNRSYGATHVFVTFETEEGQRNALTALTVGKFDVWFNNTDALAPSAVFQGRVLVVQEPKEPSAVRWMDLNVPKTTKWLQRVVSILVALGLIAAACILISTIRNQAGAMVAAVVIVIINFIIPNVCKILNLFEAHSNEGSRQASMYIKITLFRWVNTAILTKIITPFTSTLSDGTRDLLPTIGAIFLAELVLSPALRLMDLWGNIRKHIIAPRAKTQERMNLCFTGTFVHLAERYTEFTKIVLLTFFYSALFPAGFLVGAAIMFVQYFSDKYSLMRIWAPAPLIGTALAKFSRRYFFSSSLVFFAIVSSYLWSGFPFDNICEYEGTNLQNYAGDIEVIYGDGSEGTITVTNGGLYKYCRQSLFLMKKFPALPSYQPEGSNWMTPEQEKLTSIYGWTSVAVLAVWFITVFGGACWRTFLSTCRKVYKEFGADQNVDFSAVKEIYAYVPQVLAWGFAFPFLACDIDDLDQNLVGWRDPHHSLDSHNLIFDVPFPGMRRLRRPSSGDSGTNSDMNKEASSSGLTVGEQQHGPIFSIVKHWPPDWAKEKA